MFEPLNPLDRRQFVGATIAGGLLGAAANAQSPQASRQATGVKIGEVTDRSAIAWMRLTANAQHNASGKTFPRAKTIRLDDPVKIEDLRGACPGAAGQVRFRFGLREDLSDAKPAEWLDVDARSDFTRQIPLANLEPQSTYFYSAETRGPGGKPEHAPLRGSFQTAPAPDRLAPVRFTVMTCTMYKDLDHADGFHIYPAMASLKPQFYVHTGDNVYFDNDDFIAHNVALARHHWHRMHGQPRAVAFHQGVGCYFEKDDHDTLSDDCFPGRVDKRMEPLTFADGQAIFREQTPMGRNTFRTFRWGKGVQVWLTEGRDFRSPNGMVDGPDKSIWGKEQREWLMRTLRESDAEFKLLISPTPLVGPDRAGKRDNHSNANFQFEGALFRAWAAKNLGRRFMTICGDRHWQYHSVDPETGLNEFSVGAASDLHAGGTPGENKKYHRFHRVLGGFLSVEFDPEKRRLSLRHHDVHGKMVYEQSVE